MMNVDDPITSINTSTYTSTNTSTNTNTNINTNVEEAIILSDDPLSVDEDEDIPNSSMESAFNTNPNTNPNTSFSLCDFCDEFFDSDKPHNCQDLEYVMG